MGEEAKTYVVSARIPASAREWLDAYARAILSDALGAGENRSAAIKACFDLTSAALTPERLDALRTLRRDLGVPIEVVLARVLDAGIDALAVGIEPPPKRGR